MKKRILIVDDDPDVSEPLALLLGRDYDVDVAANGLEGVQRIAVKHYDAVVLDLMMPVMGGSAFKQHLDARDIDLPVLLVSGSAELAERAVALGVADHFAKPIDVALLRRRLGSLLAGETV